MADLERRSKSDEFMSMGFVDVATADVWDALRAHLARALRERARVTECGDEINNRRRRKSRRGVVSGAFAFESDGRDLPEPHVDARSEGILVLARERAPEHLVPRRLHDVLDPRRLSLTATG